MQLGFFIFDAVANAPTGQSFANTSSNNSAFGSTNTTNPFTGQSQSAINLWDVVLDPTMMGNSNFIWMLLGLVGVSSAIAVGLYLYFKIDAIILFPVFTALLGFGMVPIINMYNLIGREAGVFGCSIAVGASLCYPTAIIQMITVSTLAIWYIWACIDFWIKSSTS